MKPSLNRIEAILNQVEQRSESAVSHPELAAKPPVYIPQKRNRIYSFEIAKTQPPEINSPAQPKGDENALSGSTSSIQEGLNKEPILPNFGTDGGGESNLLSAEQTDITVLEAQLQQLLCQIQELYLAGPLVDGWLEANSLTPEPSNAMVCYDSVEDLSDCMLDVRKFAQGKVSCESQGSSYRLCGIDKFGHQWFHPCPMEQLPSVTIAIARYQQLRQLLHHKQEVEARLYKLREQREQGK